MEDLAYLIFYNTIIMVGFGVGIAIISRNWD